jgi:hypothetical protein
LGTLADDGTHRLNGTVRHLRYGAPMKMDQGCCSAPPAFMVSFGRQPDVVRTRKKATRMTPAGVKCID